MWLDQNRAICVVDLAVVGVDSVYSSLAAWWLVICAVVAGFCTNVVRTIGM